MAFVYMEILVTVNYKRRTRTLMKERLFYLDYLEFIASVIVFRRAKAKPSAVRPSPD